MWIAAVPMVEGDGCHRVAAEHRKTLVGRKFAAQSPNGRFKAGAAAIVQAGGVLLRIEVHGKNLFYFFGAKGAAPTLVVHIHFGMAGAFAVYQEEEPEPTATTRLRLESQDAKKVTAHLSAMTVVHGTPAALYEPLAAKLGVDPLREDADPSMLISKCSTCKKPIGALLVDQAFVAGVGNIYRTEILYQAGVHPNQPANSLSKEVILKIWAITVKQLQDGFTTGSIWGKKNGAFCYGLETSACGGKVKRWNLGGRAVFACSKKQQLQAGRAAVPSLVRTGTRHLGEMVSAVKAERKKRETGEGLAVQHVALKDDATRKEMIKAQKEQRMKATAKRKQSATAADRSNSKGVKRPASAVSGATKRARVK